MNQISNIQTENIYSSVLTMLDDAFTYWVKRAEQEIDWQHTILGETKESLSNKKLLIAGGTGRHSLAGVKAGYGYVTYVDGGD